ncbi:MAG TPA: chemotaxis protein CheA [Candidatus Angelobacter sp.]|nr:chemotaxis protein CheA [Candidatus Angelobacter sp.]
MSFFSDERAAELRQLFFESAAELLQTLNEEGLELEKRPHDAEILREVRRTIHTLKGDSAACGFQEFSELAHELEDVFTQQNGHSANGALADIVLIAADTFGSMLSAYRGSMQPPSGDELRSQILRLTQMPAASNGKPGKLQGRFAWSEYEQALIAEALSRSEIVYNIAFSIDPHCPMRGAAMQLIRNVLQSCGRLLAIVPDQNVLSDNLDVVEAALASEQAENWIEKKCLIPAVTSAILVERVTPPEPDVTSDADDVLDLEINATEAEAQPSSAQSHEAQSGGAAAMAETLRVDAERIDTVLNLVGELIIGKSMLHQSVGEFDKRFPKDPLRGKFADAMAFQARILNDLQKSVMKIRMVPVEQLFRRFPRVVRDTAKFCGKDVSLVVSGESTDLDKSILDMLAEPMAHLVRNAIAHGIESPAERGKAGKPAQGTLRLNAYHQGNQIVIEVSDDGRGIDAQKLMAKAINNGVINSADAAGMSETDALNLVFHPGLSTAEQVTSVSGRGVGMDVVRSVLERLKGTVSIRSTPGAGTTFLLKVPLTLAIIKALLFHVGGQAYAVPLASVVEISRITEKEIHRVDQHDVIQLRGEVLPLVHLHALAKKSSRRKKMFVIVVSLAEKKFGLIVDHLIGEEELVIKALDDHLVATELVSGASILGDGTVVLILNLTSVVAKLGRARRIMEATA